MGLIAGKAAYAICLAEDKNATNDGPLLTSPYINLAVPYEMLDVGRDFLDVIVNPPGGLSYSDRSGAFKHSINIQRAVIDPQVQPTAMQERNAIDQTISSWKVVGADPIYLFWDIAGVLATFTNYNNDHNEYLKCTLKNIHFKPMGPNLFDFSGIILNCDI